MNMPEELRAKLLARGYKKLTLGNIKLHLATGKITRTISVNGRPVAEPEFPTGDIDWDIVEGALP
jgi:hypothetical protein